MIELIEQTITKALQEAYPDFEVLPFPNNFEEFYFSSPVGCLLVRFEGLNQETQQTLTAVCADTTYNFTIIMGLRSLKFHNESYPYLKLLRKTLNGLSIVTKRLLLKNLAYETDINSDLFYSATVAVELPTIDEYKDLSAASLECTADSGEHITQ